MNDNEKKMIQAAIEEFSKKGFKKASTNMIAKHAGVSKGLLFHYYTNKENLFFACTDYAINVMVERFKALTFGSDDLVERIREVIVWKIGLSETHPLLFEFLNEAYYESDDDYYQALIKKRDEIMVDSYARLYQGINLSVLKPDILSEDAILVTNLVLEGIGKSYLEKARKEHKVLKIEELLTVYDHYLELLKKMLYKN